MPGVVGGRAGAKTAPGGTRMSSRGLRYLIIQRGKRPVLVGLAGKMCIRDSPVPQRQRHRRLVGLSYRGAGFSGPLCDLPAAYLPQGDPPSGVSAPPSPAYRGRPYLSGVPFPAGYSAALGRRGGCPHPPGADQWPGGAGRRGRRPLQRSATAGTARPKCSVGAGLVPACGRP